MRERSVFVLKVRFGATCFWRNRWKCKALAENGAVEGIVMYRGHMEGLNRAERDLLEEIGRVEERG